MNIKKFDLEDRLVEFAANVALFCTELPKDMTGSYYSNQLLRSGGSSALNFGEAQGTITQADYINKSSLCIEELKESRVNLRILKRLNYGDPSKCGLLLEEVEQYIKIIATIIKNKKS